MRSLLGDGGVIDFLIPGCVSHVSSAFVVLT